MTDIPEKQLESYYRKEPKATERAIVAFLKDTKDPVLIVHGTHAVNAYLPDWLDRDTKDWDIMTPGSAKTQAKNLEERLDTRYGGDFFVVEPGKHRGTFRIKSRVTGEVVADITLSRKSIDFRKMQGINYVSPEYLEEKSGMVLADPDAAFRHKKEQDTLQRLAVAKSVKMRKKKKRSDDMFPSLSGLR